MEKADKTAIAAQAGRRSRYDESDSLTTHRTCGITQQVTGLKLTVVFIQEILLGLVNMVRYFDYISAFHSKHAFYLEL